MRWLRVDLGSIRNLAGFVVKHAGAGGLSRSFNTRAFHIRVSTDGLNWRRVVDVRRNTDDVSRHKIRPSAARFVQLFVNTPAQTGRAPARIYDLEVLEAAPVQAAASGAAAGSR